MKTKKVIGDLADNPIVEQKVSQRPPGALADSVASKSVTYPGTDIAVAPKLDTYAGDPSSANPFRNFGLEQQERLLEVSDDLKDLDFDLFKLAQTRLRELQERFEREIHEVRMQIIAKARNIKRLSEILEEVWTD